MTPKIGMAKLKGSKAKKPKASVAGKSQVGRFGWRSAVHRSRMSLPVSRHSRNILRMRSSGVVAHLFDRYRWVWFRRGGGASAKSFLRRDVPVVPVPVTQYILRISVTFGICNVDFDAASK
jgi:hypothetical protein